MKKFTVLLLLGIAVAALIAVQSPHSADASISGEDEFLDPFSLPEQNKMEDPLENLNRALFWVNDKVYTYVLKPAFDSVPEGLKSDVTLAMEKAKDTFGAKDMGIDFDYSDGGLEAGRLVLRGVADLFTDGHLLNERSVALQQNVKDALQKFGSHLQYYLVLPILGPSTLQDGVERLTSFYLDLPEDDSLNTHQGPSVRDRLRAYENMRKTALDPYIFLREAYFQKEEKRKQVSSLSSSEEAKS